MGLGVAILVDTVGISAWYAAGPVGRLSTPPAPACGRAIDSVAETLWHGDLSYRPQGWSTQSGVGRTVPAPDCHQRVGYPRMEKLIR